MRMPSPSINHAVKASVGLSMDWLQIRLIGPYFSSFSINSYGYCPQISQNLTSISQIFASAQIARQAP